MYYSCNSGSLQAVVLHCVAVSLPAATVQLSLKRRWITRNKNQNLNMAEPAAGAIYLVGIVITIVDMSEILVQGPGFCGG